MKKLISIVALTTLTACAHQPNAAQTGILQKIGSIPAAAPQCNTKEEADCRVKWQRALDFVIRHAGMRIQTSSENLIMTAKSGDSSSLRWQMQVNRLPVESGLEEFRFVSGCNNLFSCDAQEQTVWLKIFRHYVLTGEDLEDQYKAAHQQ